MMLKGEYVCKVFLIEDEILVEFLWDVFYWGYSYYYVE